MQNPFTTTFSKIPDTTYIPTEQVYSIIDNFSYENPSESVFKITGVRGSGKTVLLGKIEQEIIENDVKEKKWVICRLSPLRDMLAQLASLLFREDFVVKDRRNRSFNISASVLGTGGGFGFSSEKGNEPFDIGIAVEEMLREALKHGKKILIGIDEVSKTKDMEIFALEFGKWLRAGYPVYLVCTGLYENIEQLANGRNLTFFRRATTIKTGPLSFVRMVEMYKNKLSVSNDIAKKLAESTLGYAYAFQELGVLAFRKKPEESFSEIIEKLKAELYSYAYEKIWEESSDEERNLLLLLDDGRDFNRHELIEAMDSPKNYSVYRDRLLRKGLVDSTRRGAIRLTLPFFGAYMKEYC